MIWRRAILLSNLLWLSAGQVQASTLVVRDSIGDSSASTDEMPGAVANHDGEDWNTPGLVLNVPEDGKVHEARFVIFAVSGNGPFFPENNLSNVYGLPMEFHIWTDGILDGADSFDENPRGLDTVPGHISVVVNSPSDSFVTIVPFGHTGPPGNVNAFTTFLVTIDLSSFNIELQGGQDYVMSLIHTGGNVVTNTGGFYRISASKFLGQEDLFRNFQTDVRPGYVQSQLGQTFQEYAGALTLSPLLIGDYNFDGDVDSFDYDTWRETFGSTTDLRADGNDDDIVDAADYVVWRNHVGEAAESRASSTAVPEPSAIVVMLLILFALPRRLICTCPFASRSLTV